MGNFYVNFSVKGTKADEIASRASSLTRDAFISEPEGNWHCVVAAETDEQDQDVISQFGKTLSQGGATVVSALNHDDGLIILEVFENGEAVAHYNSNPDYFSGEGDGLPVLQGEAKFAQVAKDVSVDDVKSLLTPEDGEEFVFAIDLHYDIVKLLGLPSFSVGAGHDYVIAGRVEGTWKKL